MKKILVTLVIVLCAGCSAKMMPRSEGVPLVESQKALKGQIVYMEYCNTCHPSGMAGLGPSIITKPLPGFLIKLQVRQGMGVMPSFDEEHITKEELDDLVAYIKEL